MSAPVRVLIADDDAASRAGVGLSLRGHGFEVCAEADTADAALDSARRERPDLCILEANLPGGGVDAAQSIRAAVPAESMSAHD